MARPMFDKSDKFTYIPSNRAQVNMMLANKVRGEKHFEFGQEAEEDVKSVKVDINTKVNTQSIIHFDIVTVWRTKQELS
jgi:hypothetical protein